MGVPGEAQGLVTINIRKGEFVDKNNPEPWKPGQYKVQLMLAGQAIRQILNIATTSLGHMLETPISPWSSLPHSEDRKTPIT